MNPAHRAVALLAACQGLLLTNGVILMAVNGLAGYALAEDKRFATLPVAALVLGSAVSTLPASHFMRHYGRRAGFVLGAVFGVSGGVIGALAMYLQSFALLLAATFGSGIYQAFGQYFRFAAAEEASEDWKARAISLTLGGGIAGGFIGPVVSRYTRDLMEPRFLACYASLVIFALIALVICASLRFRTQSDQEVHGKGRSLLNIARQPKFVVASLAAMVSYGVMNLIMSATPLAMEFCGLGFSDATFVLQWHIIGMFAPSFFTGALIGRFGVLRVLLAGAALMGVAIAITELGSKLMHFWWALFVLGIGWNFLYVGGTTLLTETYAPAEKAKTQGFNDFLVFFAMACSTSFAGLVVTSAGWNTLNHVAIPYVLATACATLWLASRRRASP